MWSIFVAVLGGIYLAGKMSSERIASKKATRKREDWKCAFDEWRANITDEHLEKQLELFIHDNPTSAAQAAQELCKLMPEDQQNPTTYLRVLLADKGKIRKLDANFGIEAPLYIPKPALTAEQQYRNFFEFVIWLNRNLERNGADTGEILFIPSYPAPNSKKYYSIKETEGLFVHGTYVWSIQNICAYLDKK